ncbi:LamG-like jellyroll fold domain-containing protein [Enterococcus sp. BWR-S5]|uniref:LamG-like jellyroll fold domain-containing protein n=1 Tax=Enterococcus sp. BWR-S5 TaxID=2787714 RepID=UPI001921888A|nr:LamG-like jellyroll fold domain-containing protein [Enterococcus sp. BWR-S5]MBL1227129.1 Ig-like domain-containing protein [Enterococcus sp. BWR-S5]
MKKCNIVLGSLLIVFVSVFLSSLQVDAAEIDFISPTNLITVKNEIVKMPEEVLYTTSDNEFGKIPVTWETIDPTIFEQPGKYKVAGKTNDGKKVNGSIRVFDTDKEVTIAAVGDSLTAGYGMYQGAGHKYPYGAYPAQLGNRLGQFYTVKNFGYSGASLSAKGWEKYIEKDEYRDSLESNFDAVIIQLGSNDAHFNQWSMISPFFKDEYISFIKSYKEARPEATVYVCVPAGLNGDTGRIAGFPEVIKEILKAVKEMDNDITVIDNFTPTEILDEKYYIGQNDCHPNAKGTSVVADTVYKAIHGEKAAPVLTGEIAARNYNRSHMMVGALDTRTNEFFLNDIAKEDWVYFENVDFDQNDGLITLTTKMPNTNLAGTVQAEVRLDSIDGELLAQDTIIPSSDWAETTLYNKRVSRKRNIYIKFTYSSTDKTQFDSIVSMKSFNVSKKKASYLKNGNFEQGLSYWDVQDSACSGVDTYMAYGGVGQKLWFYNSNTYTGEVSQTVENIENGVYVVSAMVQHQLNQAEASELRIDLFDGKQNSVALNYNPNYQYVTTEVTVVNGKIKLGFYQKGRNATLHVDNVTLEKKKTENELLAYWDFDQVANGKITDLTGNGFDGILRNSASLGQGKIGNALTLNGYNQYMEVAHSQNLNFSKADSYTLSAWVKLPKNNTSWRTIIQKGRDTASFYGLWAAGWPESTNSFTYGQENISGAGAAEEWVHLVAVQNGNGTRTLYVNGKSTGNGQAIDGISGSPLIIGASRYQVNTAFTEYFNGSIDEISIYNYALSKENIWELANGSVGRIQ